MPCNSEKVDMMLVCGKCKRNNTRAAARLYAERYPDRFYSPPNYFIQG